MYFPPTFKLCSIGPLAKKQFGDSCEGLQREPQMSDKNHHPWNNVLVPVVEVGFTAHLFPPMTNGIMRELPNCSSLYVSVLGDISSSVCSHIVSDYLQSCNPLNPDRQERADLYSSGPPHNVTAWRERRSECARMCVRDIYLRVHVQVCTSLWIFVFVWGSLLLHTRSAAQVN